MRRRRDAPHVAIFAALTAAVAAVLVLATSGRSVPQTQPVERVRWAGLAGDARAKVSVGQRMIVLLNAPSLANRVAAAGGLVSATQERRWTETILSQQKLLLARLSAEGVQIVPELTFTRTVDGFSAPLDARSLALLERAPEVKGVYPVRPAYPASLPAGALTQSGVQRAHVVLPGFDGRGVDVALLDTGVDRGHPFLQGRITDSADVVGGDEFALAAADPDDRGRIEKHGTEIAGVLAGGGGPDGLQGVAPGASLVPIRVAGWQRDATGAWSVYGRTDQVIAGLERAVDPNGDGDAHDAARVALTALSEPFAAFADGPEAQAVLGATRLDTLVVAAAGNDGPAGPSFGSISAPGGAPAALTVGAADLRRRHATVRVLGGAGTDVLFDRRLPLVNDVSLSSAMHLAAAVGRRGAAAADPARFFDRRGASLVAGRAAIAVAGDDPEGAVEAAVTAGARAVLLFGGALPPGALGLATRDVPVVALPTHDARALLARLRGGERVAVSLGGVRRARNANTGSVAGFSSQGLAFDGRVKPDLVAPGVALATAEPAAGGAAARYGTVNGSSAAAAVVAGAAALLAEARPSLDASALKGALVGTARPLRGVAITAQGSGMIDVGAAAAAEVVAQPATLALGRAHAGWRTVQRLRVRNVSTRRENVYVSVHQQVEGAAGLAFTVRPHRLVVPRGRTATATLRVRVTTTPIGAAPAAGVVVLNPAGGQRMHVPWVISFTPPPRDLVGTPQLAVPGNRTGTAFAPSDVAPALLTFDAGAVTTDGARTEVQPVAALDLQLYSSNGSLIGTLARLRDLLPGRYQVGLTGRDPTGAVLPPGDYTVRLLAIPTLPGPPSRRIVHFTIK